MKKQISPPRDWSILVTRLKRCGIFGVVRNLRGRPPKSRAICGAACGPKIQAVKKKEAQKRQMRGCSARKKKSWPDNGGPHHPYRSSPQQREEPYLQITLSLSPLCSVNTLTSRNAGSAPIAQNLSPRKNYCAFLGGLGSRHRVSMVRFLPYSSCVRRGCVQRFARLVALCNGAFAARPARSL
ncbi:hypothetical protein METSCH_B04490 [Metschnikowia aff. pulcherrima]|uniref:Uncharacterized protein n=1 Tax=Metschnikowia aff. pulcherrima TaxID=2163413 RepID=A0A4P6XKK6_9ASCO|nr:hypothetical protein METSCH_B04490 [Metschnikowia aff. pulcherrima]